MFSKLVPLNRETHANLKVKPIDNFGFAKGFHIASLMVHEFARAASVYPIVFLEDKEKDEFRPVVLLGLEAGENLFLAEDGSWNASYVPAIIRRYPFALARLGEDEDQFTVCLDEDSDFVSAEEGEPLFDDEGEPTGVVENVKRYLGEMQQMEVFTQQFCHFLSEHNLFNPLNMRVRQGDTMRNVTGCYVINEERIYNLSDKLFLEIRDKRYLAPMFSHLTSLSQIERLAKEA
ncbi:peptidase [Spiribacter sp. C176]|uniref:Peptidase n=1 Tax=Spiribacter salilacus TaxID=2664894 RepID=A0A6N7QRP8_9GAMM|nr:SapC family protein [Spiribacter salilacus]MRH79116.1 peptidase [Spiribacter salilacus]